MKRRFAKISLVVFGVLMLFVGIAMVIFELKKEQIVNHLLETANADFNGAVHIDAFELSFLEDFPLVDIDLKGFSIFEGKDKRIRPIAQFQDVFVGFDLFDIINGDMTIRLIHLDGGHCDLVQYANGQYNILHALETNKPTEELKEDFHIDLKSVIIKNVDFSKESLMDSVKIDLFLTEVKSDIKSDSLNMVFGLDAMAEFSLLMEGDSSFIRKKHLKVQTDVVFDKKKKMLNVQPTTIGLEKASFDIQGNIDFSRDVFLDLKVSGDKPNFDLFLALAPNELKPVLDNYNNRGRIFFDTIIKGSCINGQTPAIDAKFGCQEGFVENVEFKKEMRDLAFSGYFTNGSKRTMETMEFGLNDFTMRPEVGVFSGSLKVKNFIEPDIDLKLHSDFDLNFITKFFGLKDYYDLQGKVLLTMNFHDIIDLAHPEKSIEKLNESYYTELKVENLKFVNANYPLPIHDFDLDLKVDGHYGHLDVCDLHIGKSDIKIKGSISDLPAILHHTNIPVVSKLKIESRLIDLKELSGGDSSSVDERIHNLAVDLHFNSSARSFTESKYLPIGEFFIDDLYAKFDHYPHTLKDFHADVYITESDFKVIDFSGLLDQSDFHFSGKLKHYDLWFLEQPKGRTHLDFVLTSNRVQLNNILGYKGMSLLPEDYKLEEVDDLVIQGKSDLFFDGILKEASLDVLDCRGKMKSHKIDLKQLNFNLTFDEDHIGVKNGEVKLGNSDVVFNGYFGLGNERKKKNFIALKSEVLDFDQLFSWSEKLTQNTNVDGNEQVASSYHDEGFNIYQLPMPDLQIGFEVGDLRYHKHHLQHLKADLTTHKDHFIDVKNFQCHMADGKWSVHGVLNARNPERIFWKGQVSIDKMDLDQLFFKFDNFGQDYIVSKNLHGKGSALIDCHLLMHKDFAPILERSEVHMDLTVFTGVLENFTMLEAMSEYFSDKNLSRVAFDTLQNHIDFINGNLSIPNMSISSTLGYFEISGQQDLDFNMDYYVRIPWKMVSEVAASKIFGKPKKQAQQEDELEMADNDGKRRRFVNVRIKGNLDNYKVSLEKAKELKGKRR